MIQFILGVLFGMAIMGTALMIYIGVHDTATNTKADSSGKERYDVRLRLKQRIEIIDEINE